MHSEFGGEKENNERTVVATVVKSKTSINLLGSSSADGQPMGNGERNAGEKNTVRFFLLLGTTTTKAAKKTTLYAYLKRIRLLVQVVSIVERFARALVLLLTV